MKNLLLAGALALTTSLPLVAAPWSGADCVLTSEADLQGTSLAAFRHQQSWAVGALDFAPQSVFLANGAAIKLFSDKHFDGNGSFVTDNYGRAKKTEGGVYINLKDLYFNGNVASFACVDGGTLFPSSSVYAREAGVRYFNDKVFSLEGYRGNHVGSTQVTVTFKDGKKLVTATDISSTNVSNIFVMDLESGAITVTFSGYGQEWTRTVASLVYGATPEQQLMYIGATSKMSGIISEIYANKSSGRDRNLTVPNLELEAVLRAVNSENRLR